MWPRNWARNSNKLGSAGGGPFKTADIGESGQAVAVAATGVAKAGGGGLPADKVMTS